MHIFSTNFSNENGKEKLVIYDLKLKKICIIKKGKTLKPKMYRILVSSWWASFLVAFFAVNWSVLVGFEWNGAFLFAISTDCLVHFSVIVHLLYHLLLNLLHAKIASYMIIELFVVWLIKVGANKLRKAWF